MRYSLANNTVCLKNTNYSLSEYRGMQAQVKPHLWLHTGPWPVESGCQAGQRECLDLRTAPTGCSVGPGKGRVVGGAQGGEGELSCRPAYPPPRPPAVVVPFRKVLVVWGVNRPEVAFAVVAAACFDEAIVQGQVVTHAVPPVFILLQQAKKRNMVKTWKWSKSYTTGVPNWKLT